MIPRRIDPNNPRRRLYLIGGREWSVVRLAVLSGWIRTSQMQYRLDNWDADRIWSDIVSRYEQTADFRAGRPMW